MNDDETHIWCDASIASSDHIPERAAANAAPSAVAAEDKESDDDEADAAAPARPDESDSGGAGGEWRLLAEAATDVDDEAEEEGRTGVDSGRPEATRDAAADALRSLWVG